MARAADDPGTLRCRCGYDLRGLSQERCPECGLPFEVGVRRRRPLQAVVSAMTGLVSVSAAILGAVIALQTRIRIEADWGWCGTTRLRLEDGLFTGGLCTSGIALAAWATAALARCDSRAARLGFVAAVAA